MKPCVSAGVTPLTAVNVSGKLPPGPVGVPDSRAVPFPLSVKVTPAGNVPVSEIAETRGADVVRTLNVPACPIVKVVVAGLMNRIPVGAETATNAPPVNVGG